MRSVRPDREKFGPLIERALPYVRGKISLMMLRKFGDAAVEDVLQNAAMKAWMYRAQFEGRSKFTTWFTRIAINEALMWIRKAKVKDLRNVSIDEPLDGHDSTTLMASLEETLAEPSRDPEEKLLLKEQRVALLTALKKISSKKNRQALLLRHFYEYSTDETSRALGICQSSVKARSFRARAEMREHLA